MKKMINRPETVVPEMCCGMAAAHPGLEFIQKYKIMKKRTISQDKVTLISGGGSGHEPAHAGYVGRGMLDAAVCGDIFASPSQIQVYKAIRETASDKGTLLIIKNYSGDMMNFKNAAHMAKEDGLTVDYVKVEDDIAVQDSLYTVGRRGVAGTVLVHKIAGAAAETGLELKEVKRVAQKAAANVRSIGFALTSCTVPAKGTPTFSLGDKEMEYGVGIHGEPGIRRESIQSADDLAKRMVSALAEDFEKEPGIGAGFAGKTALLVNGFGGTPLQELYLFANSAMAQMKEKGIRVARLYVGNYMTSIDMAGASLSLLKLDKELEEYLKAPSFAPAFMVEPDEGGSRSTPVQRAEGETRNTSVQRAEDESRNTPVQREEEEVCFVPMEKPEGTEEVSYSVETDKRYGVIEGNKISLHNMIYLIDKMSEIVIANEVPFCELDSHAGDGDFGMSVAKGFRQLKREWGQLVNAHTDSIGQFLEECSLIIMEYCGGASGPIWGSAFRGAAKSAGHADQIDANQFAQMLQAAVKSIQETGRRSFGKGAQVGDKTLIDALVPCADLWAEEAKKGTPVAEIFKRGALAAVEGAKKTEAIKARMGRAGTVGDRSIGYPDAGAYGLGVIFTEISKSLSSS